MAVNIVEKQLFLNINLGRIIKPFQTNWNLIFCREKDSCHSSQEPTSQQVYPKVRLFKEKKSHKLVRTFNMCSLFALLCNKAMKERLRFARLHLNKASETVLCGQMSAAV